MISRHKQLKSIMEDLPHKVVEEYAFARRLYKRQFRADWAILKWGILVEYEGLATPFTKSRHTSIRGYTRDSVKYNMAAVMGFAKLSYVRSTCDPDQVLYDIETIIKNKQDSFKVEHQCCTCNEDIYMPVSILVQTKKGYECLMCEWLRVNK